MAVYGTVIVDSRRISKETIDRHMPFLPGWELNVFTQLPNREYEANFYTCPPIKNGHDYNNFLMSFQFWQKLEKYDRVLIFQHDSGILREGVEEFLEYDFIGAPIKHMDWPAMNGGFSLRNPKKMLECLSRGLPKHSHNEDIRFCYAIQNSGKLPTFEVAKRFSVETIFELGSFGYHQVESWLTQEQIELLKSQYDLVSK